MTLRRLGYHAASNREIFLLELESPVLPTGLGLPAGFFACLTIMDASGLSVDVLADFSEQLLRAGCVYLCAWGPDCERVHDIMDAVVVGDGTDDSDTRDIMTTWHSNGPLADALDFLLRLSTPYEHHEAGCRTDLIISVASSTWRREVESLVARAVKNQ